MVSDCAFFTGSTHPVCQDYARHGRGEAGPYVLIADGCSSSRDTDIGARLLVLAAEKLINVPDLELFYQMSIVAAADSAAKLGLPPTCLDATLMMIRMEKGVPVASIYGDGYIASRKGGKTKIIKVYYPNNIPNYPSYILRDQAKLGKLEPGLVEETEADGCTLTVERESVDGLYVKHFDSDCDFIAIMSDGAGSFLRPVKSETSKTNEGVPQNEIMPELLGFKTFQPGFVQRRLKRLVKDTREKEWQHYDDLSIGALALKEEGKNGVLLSQK